MFYYIVVVILLDPDLIHIYRQQKLVQALSFWHLWPDNGIGKHILNGNLLISIRMGQHNMRSYNCKKRSFVLSNIPRIGKLPYGAKKGFIERKALLKKFFIEKRLYWNKRLIEKYAYCKNCEIRSKLWKLVKTMKFGQNSKIW